MQGKLSEKNAGLTCMKRGSKKGLVRKRLRLYYNCSTIVQSVAISLRLILRGGMAVSDFIKNVKTFGDY